MGITNFKSLRKIPIEYLEASFGRFWAVELKKLSYGEDDSLLIKIGEVPKMKSVSRTYTLYEDTTNFVKIKAALRNLCEEVSFKAREMKMAGRMIGVEVRGGGLEDFKHKTLKYFVDSGKEIFEVVWGLFSQMKWPGTVRFLGVWLGDLRPKQELTLTLLPEKQKEEKLNLAMDQINKKFGELTIYPAVMLGNSLIKSEVNGFLGDKIYQFNR